MLSIREGSEVVVGKDGDGIVVITIAMGKENVRKNFLQSQCSGTINSTSQ